MEQNQFRVGNQVEVLNKLYDKKIGMSSIASNNFKKMFSEILKKEIWATVILCEVFRSGTKPYFGLRPK